MKDSQFYHKLSHWQLLIKEVDGLVGDNASLTKKVAMLERDIKWLHQCLDKERKQDKNRDTLRLEQLTSAYEDFINSVSDISSEFPRMSFNPDHPD
jgi:uncharacterized protein YoxC